MGVLIVTCPVCKQKLGLQAYIHEGEELVCANERCQTTLRLTKRKPLKVEIVPVSQTLNADSQPESYG